MKLCRAYALVVHPAPALTTRCSRVTEASFAPGRRCPCGRAPQSATAASAAERRNADKRSGGHCTRPPQGHPCPSAGASWPWARGRQIATRQSGYLEAKRQHSTHTHLRTVLLTARPPAAELDERAAAAAQPHHEPHASAVPKPGLSMLNAHEPHGNGLLSGRVAPAPLGCWRMMEDDSPLCTLCLIDPLPHLLCLCPASRCPPPVRADLSGSSSWPSRLPRTPVPCH
jgi:hypothetical protein